MGAITMTEWHRQQSRVYGGGQSYNCTNIATAKTLHETLTTYEKTYILNRNIEEQYDRITKQIIQLKLSISILTEEVQSLEASINAINNR